VILRALALSLALCAPAGADLVYWGPSSRRAEVQAIWDSLPKRGRTLDCLVWLVRHDGSRKMLLKSYLGRYYFFEQVAIIEPNGSKTTIRHEIGHHVWIQLTREENADWSDWWRANKRLMPNDYARTSAAEGFAECYAFTYGQGSQLHPDAAAVIRGIVGE
jgi:hypothetical protein